jgi:hypothetical protein
MSKVNYHVRFRYITPDMAFTPLYLIGIDHTTVEADNGATEWDLRKAICKEFGNLNYVPDYVSILTFQKLN